MGQSAIWALRKNRNSTFTLQITSMIDMFTIILVFLLKSYASSAVDVPMSKDVQLPSSTSQEKAVEALKLVVTKKGIFVDDKNIVAFENGQIPSSALDAGDQKFIKPLYDALKAQADKTKGIAKQNDSVAFEGKVIFQGDQGMSYQLMRKVMYTSAFAGYTDFKFAVVALQ
jgi:biopolymer transport protein ExbD